ncbi:serine/threonine-protein kinase [Kitasatospora sp. NPDC002227]|uniref:serine/threonine-protein kinase n=1 Tax=Kitasatospora sp. NPDC002227 TaxID=3154773 RepID=UPI0033347969
MGDQLMMDGTIAEPLGSDDPQEIGSFHIIGLLGVGGMGEVYLGASDRGYAAVKRVRPRLVPSERFEREVGILHRVPPGVGPRVLASDGTAERPWFAAEYVPGLTVDEAVRLRGPLPAEALWLLLAETAAQLRAVHAAGIVHRDVKPGNVMLVRDGVQLIDFGIARAADQARLTRSGGSYGTQGFSAPEQQAGDENVDAPADVFSLGALLLYAASGRTPGVIPDAEPLRAVDPDLAAVVESCTSADPGARPTAHQVAESARAHLPVPAPAWPAEIAARIAARRAFAATPVSKLDTVPPPELTAGPTPEAVPTVPFLPRLRRKHLLLLSAAALIALGAVAVFMHSPSTLPPDVSLRSPGSTPTTVRPATTTTTAPSPSPTPTPTTPTVTPTVIPSPSRTDPGAAPSPTHRSTTTAPGPVAVTPPATPPPAAGPTASPIGGINGGDDPAQVKGSEADTGWVANDATCSAWLDADGSGRLAGVLNTSLGQTCDAELFRSDGIAYTFQAGWGAAKTNFIPDTGTTMWICVWNASDQAGEQCSARFAMNGTTPVRR